MVTPTSESAHEAQVAAEVSAKATSRQELAELTAVQALPDMVELTFTAPVQFRSNTIKGQAGSAGRFYIDISPAMLTPQRGATFEIATGPVQRVRLSLFRAGVVRVVLDLREERNFQLATLIAPYRLVITAEEKKEATNRTPLIVQAREKTQTKKTSRPSVQRENEEPAPGFAEVEWRTRRRPWTLMEPLRSGETKTALPELPSVTDEKQRGRMSSRTEPAPLLLTAATENPQSFVSSELELSQGAFANETAPSCPEPFFDGWTRELTNQDYSSTHFAGEYEEAQDNKRFLSRPEETKSLSVQKLRSVDSSSEQPRREIIRTRGAVMHEIWLGAMTVGVGLAFLAGIGSMLLWNLRKRGAAADKNDGWETRMAYLEEAVNRAGMLNSNFFHALEVSRKRLESLLTQADVTEQNLRRLLHQTLRVGEQPTTRGADSLETAALLLAEGEKVQQVARALKLPLAQVRLIQELRQHTRKEKPADATEKFAAERWSPEAVSTLDGPPARLNGAARNGMYLADNGQLL